MTVDVAIRLGLQGGQAATRGIEDFGNKGAKSFKEMRQEAAALPPHLVAVSRGVGAVKDKVEELSASTGTFGNVAGAFGKYGLFVSAGAAALGAAAVATKAAIEGAVAYGDAIGDAAQKLGVGTTMLQEYRFAMIKVGGEAGDADAAIGGFTKTLGLAEAGYKKALLGFKQLGFSRQDIKSFKDVDEALKAVAERVANLASEQQRQAIAEKLGLGPMIPLLREGADGMQALFERARALGWVMSEEVIAKAGDAADKLEDLHEVIKVELNTALIEAAPLLVSVSEAMVDGARNAQDFAKELSSLKALIDDWVASNPQVKIAFEVTWKFLNKVEDFFQGISKGALEKMGFNKGMLDQLYGDMPEFPAHDGGAVDDRRTGADGSGIKAKPTGQLGSATAEQDAAKAAANAEKERKRALEASARTTTAIAAADARELAAQRQYAGTLDQLLETELDALDKAETRRLAEIDRDVAEGKLDKLKIDELKKAESDAFAAEREVVRRKAREDTQQRRLADEKALAEVTQQLLSLASAGARTADERRKIELEILESQQKIAKSELERALAADGDPNHDDAWKDARRADQQRLFAAQRGGVERGTMGPLADYADRLIRTNGEVKESLQAIAVDGFKTLNDGLVEATLNAGSLGDVFADVGKLIVSSLEHVVIQLFVIKPMVDALMRSINGSGGGGGGWLNALVSGVGNWLGGSIGGGSSNGYASDLGDGRNLVAQLSKGRAGGGAVYRGDVRPINEHGVERIAAFSGDGYVMDAARTAREITDASAVSGSGGGDRPIAVNLNNGSPVPLQATATERDDGAGGRRLDIDLVELIDSRVARGKREMFDGSMDNAFQSKFGIRPRLSGG